MNRGILYALLSALLFGLSTPLAKLLTAHVGPVALAALLYLGAGVGLLGWRIVRHDRGAPFARGDLRWFAGAILAGGVLAPVMLMWGLQQLSGAHAALLLNLESVFTATLAWFVFREHFDRRIAIGMAFIVAGGVALAWSGSPQGSGGVGAIAVMGACLLWGIDNNLTRKIAGADPLRIAGWKGLVAGLTNAALAFIVQESLPASATIASAAFVGLLGYGISLVLFVLALGQLGASRTGAYFALAPFVGAAASFVLLGETPTIGFGIGLVLMAIGVGLHLTEHHAHQHTHEALVHTHEHVHDEHHQHEHDFPWDGTEPHTHPHAHTVLTHSHPHFPDLHHRHSHS